MDNMTMDERKAFLASPHIPVNTKRAAFGLPEFDGLIVPEKDLDYFHDMYPGMMLYPCSHHVLVQHRDRNPPWCNRCGFDNAVIKWGIIKEEPVATDAVNIEQHGWNDSGTPRPLKISSGQNLQKRAMDLVASYISSHLEITDATPDFEVYVVWFSKVLQNWKALVSITLPDGKYYEVTYNGDKQKAYVDVYVKINNISITMGEDSV